MISTIDHDKGYVLQNDSQLRNATTTAKAPEEESSSVGLLVPATYTNRLRYECGRIINHQATDILVITLIVFNSILLGVETFGFAQNSSRIRHTFEALDSVCLILFTVEIGIHLIYRKLQLFREPWLVFDLLLVVVSWTSHSLDVGRAFRILRALLILGKMSSLKELVRALVTCVPRILAVGMLLLLILYVYGVIFTSLFKDLYADGYLDEDYFSRLDYTLFTLFQIMLMDDWATITKQVMVVYPWAWLIFILYILTTTFLVLNLAVGVISSAVADVNYEEIESQVMRASSSIGDRNDITIGKLESKIDDLTIIIEKLVQQQNQSTESLYTLNDDSF